MARTGEQSAIMNIHGRVSKDSGVFDFLFLEDCMEIEVLWHGNMDRAVQPSRGDRRVRMNRTSISLQFAAVILPASRDRKNYD